MGLVMLNIDSRTAVFCCESALGGGYQIHRHVIFPKGNIWLLREFAQQSLLDFLPGCVLHMQHAPLRVTALFAQIKLAMTRDFPLIELHAERRELPDSLRSLGHYRPDHRFVTKPRASLECISHVQLE